jgi:positive regulator of sigma E activity
MKTGTLLFITGLFLFMLGIYLSTYIASLGVLLSVGGGMMLGVSSYFMGTHQVKLRKRVNKS